MDDETIEYRLQISRKKYFNNGLIVSETELMNEAIEGINRAFSKTVHLAPKVRKGRSELGVKADELNVKLRQCLLSEFPNMKIEVTVNDGVFWYKNLTEPVSKSGFDFAFIDLDSNIRNERNLFVGDKEYNDGEKKLLNQNRNFDMTREAWKDAINGIGGEPFHDIPVEKSKYTILGELQFGNWALRSEDFLRLLQAEENPGVDFYFYIVADGNLLKRLSVGIVTFERAIEMFESSKSLFRTPTMLIGLDAIPAKSM